MRARGRLRIERGAARAISWRESPAASAPTAVMTVVRTRLGARRRRGEVVRWMVAKCYPDPHALGWAACRCCWRWVPRANYLRSKEPSRIPPRRRLAWARADSRAPNFPPTRPRNRRRNHAAWLEFAPPIPRVTQTATEPRQSAARPSRARSGRADFAAWAPSSFPARPQTGSRFAPPRAAEILPRLRNLRRQLAGAVAPFRSATEIAGALPRWATARAGRGA